MIGVYSAGNSRNTITHFCSLNWTLARPLRHTRGRWNKRNCVGVRAWPPWTSAWPRNGHWLVKYVFTFGGAARAHSIDWFVRWVAMLRQQDRPRGWPPRDRERSREDVSVVDRVRCTSRLLKIAEESGSFTQGTIFGETLGELHFVVQIKRTLVDKLMI